MTLEIEICKHVSLLMNNYGKYTHSPEEDELLRQKKQHEYVQWNEFLKVCFSQKNKKLPSVFDTALRETRQRIIGENAAVVLRDLISGLGLNQSRANGTDIASFLRLFEQIRSRNFPDFYGKILISIYTLHTIHYETTSCMGIIV